MTRDEKTIVAWVAVAVGVVFMLLMLHVMYVYQTADVTTATVNRLDHKVSGGGRNMPVSDEYLIFTSKGVFKNADEMFRMKWNSSDIQGELKEGATYRLHYYGWRVPFLSWYPNVYKVEEVGEAKK